jgi:hypothetical protein
MARRLGLGDGHSRSTPIDLVGEVGHFDVVEGRERI